MTTGWANFFMLYYGIFCPVVFTVLLWAIRAGHLDHLLFPDDK